MKLLLVEDEKLLSKLLFKGLKKLNYTIDCAFDGEEALKLYDINSYDLIILDINLPKIDGMQVLHKIRENDSQIKVLILSAKNTVDDKIKGLDSGSNDYLTKPFDFNELEARIRNLLRQKFSTIEVNLHCGDINLDTANKCVYYGQELINLTKKEYSILEYLMFNSNKILSAEDIIEHVWDSEADLFSNSFKFHIHSLRKKLENISGNNNYIINIRGQGYKISVPQEGINL